MDTSPLPIEWDPGAQLQVVSTAGDGREDKAQGTLMGHRAQSPAGADTHPLPSRPGSDFEDRILRKMGSQKVTLRETWDTFGTPGGTRDTAGDGKGAGRGPLPERLREWKGHETP